MTKFQAFRLRMRLLRIWVVKNLATFIKLVAFLLILTIIAAIVFEHKPITEFLIDHEILPKGNRGTVEQIVAIVGLIVSVSAGTGLISRSLKRLALTDIKSTSLKMALIKSGMYFNADGRLVKRIEEATQTDIDRDGKVGDSGVLIEDLPAEGILPGLKRAGQELNTIFTTKIESPEDATTIIKETDMEHTKTAVEALRKQVNKDAETATAVTISEITGHPQGIVRRALNKLKALFSIKKKEPKVKKEKVAKVKKEKPKKMKKIKTPRVKKEKVAKVKKEKPKKIKTPRVKKEKVIKNKVKENTIPPVEEKPKPTGMVTNGLPTNWKRKK